MKFPPFSAYSCARVVGSPELLLTSTEKPQTSISNFSSAFCFMLQLYQLCNKITGTKIFQKSSLTNKYSGTTSMGLMEIDWIINSWRPSTPLVTASHPENDPLALNSRMSGPSKSPQSMPDNHHRNQWFSFPCAEPHGRPV